MRPKLPVLLKTQAEALLKLGRANEALENLRHGIEDLHGYHDPDNLLANEMNRCGRNLASWSREKTRNMTLLFCDRDGKDKAALWRK